ncbi:MAG: hypothetical protein Q9165_005064 [Trypethelium subeluteriae]
MCPSHSPSGTQVSFDSITDTFWPFTTVTEVPVSTETIRAQSLLAGHPTETSSPFVSTYKVTETSTTRTIFLLAPMFQLNWQGSDLTWSVTATQSPSTATQSPGTATANFTQSRKVLSIGAKVAMGVVIPFLALLAVAILFYMTLKRRKQEIRQGLQAGYQDKPELDATPLSRSALKEKRSIEKPASDGPVESGEDAIHELPAPDTIHELDSPVQSVGHNARSKDQST